MALDYKKPTNYDTDNFANTATDSVAGADTFTTGWDATTPPQYQFENYVQNRQDKMLSNINKYGIAEWDGTTSYKKGSIVTYLQSTTSEHRVYISLIDSNANHNPETGTGEWTLIDNAIRITDQVSAEAPNINSLAVTTGAGSDQALKLANVTEVKDAIGVMSIDSSNATFNDNSLLAAKDLTNIGVNPSVPSNLTIPNNIIVEGKIEGNRYDIGNIIYSRSEPKVRNATVSKCNGNNITSTTDLAKILPPVFDFDNAIETGLKWLPGYTTTTLPMVVEDIFHVYTNEIWALPRTKVGTPAWGVGDILQVVRSTDNGETWSMYKVPDIVAAHYDSIFGGMGYENGNALLWGANQSCYTKKTSGSWTRITNLPSFGAATDLNGGYISENGNTIILYRVAAPTNANYVMMIYSLDGGTTWITVTSATIGYENTSYEYSKVNFKPTGTTNEFLMVRPTGRIDKILLGATAATVTYIGGGFAGGLGGGTDVSSWSIASGSYPSYTQVSGNAIQQGRGLFFGDAEELGFYGGNSHVTTYNTTTGTFAPPQQSFLYSNVFANFNTSLSIGVFPAGLNISIVWDIKTSDLFSIAATNRGVYINYEGVDPEKWEYKLTYTDTGDFDNSRINSSCHIGSNHITSFSSTYVGYIASRTNPILAGSSFISDGIGNGRLTTIPKLENTLKLPNIKDGWMITKIGG